jgi:peptide/nickel transport system permease protein
MKLLLGLLKRPSFLLGMATFLGAVLLAIFYPLLSGADPLLRDGPPFAAPSASYLLGTNNEGQDMLAQLIYGLRSSLIVGVLAGLFATVLGTAAGVLAGYKGGLIDDLLTTVTNLFLVIPSMVILILISNSIEKRSLGLIAVIIGATTWTWTARSVRAQTASLRDRDHVNLARLNGDGTASILARQIVPYLLSYIFMVFILQMASGILSEAAISMLGLGPYDSVSLGQILNNAQVSEALINGNWWAFLPAAFLISVLTFSLYMVNTSMEEVFNPRLRK